MTKPLDANVDYWFARRLGARMLFLGLTDSDIRRERIREEILERRVAEKRIGKTRAGNDETFRQAFERIYRCNLENGDKINAQSETESLQAR